jgi:hypothetical protein
MRDSHERELRITRSGDSLAARIRIAAQIVEQLRQALGAPACCAGPGGHIPRWTARHQ